MESTFSEQIERNPSRLRILVSRPYAPEYEFWLTACVQWGYTTVDGDDLIGTRFEGRTVAVRVPFDPEKPSMALQQFLPQLASLFSAWPEIVNVKNNVAIYAPETGSQIDQQIS